MLLAGILSIGKLADFSNRDAIPFGIYLASFGRANAVLSKSVQNGCQPRIALCRSNQANRRASWSAARRVRRVVIATTFGMNGLSFGK